MKYSTKTLAKEYIKYLDETEISLTKPISQTYDLKTYIDNEYLNIIHSIDQDFAYVDSLDISEQFLTH